MIAMIQDDPFQVQDFRARTNRYPSDYSGLLRCIHELGYGFLESVYREAMRIALMQVGFIVETEVPIEVHFRGLRRYLQSRPCRAALHSALENSKQ